MEPGELRRFDVMTGDGSHDNRRVSGKLFVVVAESAVDTHECVDILLDGTVERYWGYDWVNIRSEVVSAG